MTIVFAQGKMGTEQTRMSKFDEGAFPNISFQKRKKEREKERDGGKKEKGGVGGFLMINYVWVSQLKWKITVNQPANLVCCGEEWYQRFTLHVQEDVQQ